MSGQVFWVKSDAKIQHGDASLKNDTKSPKTQIVNTFKTGNLGFWEFYGHKCKAGHEPLALETSIFQIFVGNSQFFPGKLAIKQATNFHFVFWGQNSKNKMYAIANSQKLLSRPRWTETQFLELNWSWESRDSPCRDKSCTLNRKEK